MAIQYADFITAFPEFSDITSFPEATVTFWLTQGYSQVSPRIFGNQYDFAVMLWTAHNLVYARRNIKASSGSGVPGDGSGATTSKSVADVSVGYSTNTSIDGAGAWNATSYGQRYYTLIRALGTGPRYVAGPRRQFL
ncbi:DUF4054 domain-containing protein [Allorhizobium ampelinum]|uniref:DUF4054 domain-containing protein n=1 Tax=Allorhizobium ampelinum TaxID=3025782 RepID=UPI000B40690F|nr:DUF4054 domain-containing protein [Allorhizobium ampelinum]NTA27403.1 DUF4054 domain-containing protein [Allorhizobium ampelinum]OVE94459.1 hypothetical protein B7W85_12980 [Allorhizobium ampelinum]